MRPRAWCRFRIVHPFVHPFRYNASYRDGQNGRGAPMAGSMRQRGNDSGQLRVHAGRDVSTGRKHYVERTFRGTKREASKALAAMVAEVDRRPVGSSGKGTVASLCREWLEHATPSFSAKTVETSRMYIEDPIIPALGAILGGRMSPCDLEPF